MTYKQLRLLFIVSFIITVLLFAIAHVNRTPESPRQRVQREALLEAGKTACPEDKTLVIYLDEDPYVIRCE